MILEELRAKLLASGDYDSVETTELLVIGSGVSGLAVALASTPRKVTLVSKTEIRSGSSPWAQGGIAAAVGETDNPSLHAEDTERVARGLGKPEVIRKLVESAPAEIDRLIELGTRFDLNEQGELALGREGGHSRHRILHAGGDATGAEIVRSLIEEVRKHERIQIEENLFAIDLLTAETPEGDKRVVGLVGLQTDPSEVNASTHATRRVALLAEGVVLATGGLGQLYRHTTNPNEVTGDGMAMAARAGARMTDFEFIQFHPTALAVGQEAAANLQTSPLLTEALRGAGAYLIDQEGRRIMEEVHPDAELAPRDLVARTIWMERAAGNEVFLDVRHLAGILEKKFPTVIKTCAQANLDPYKEAVPVSPAAHYTMGGVEVNGDGETSLSGLWACGEVTVSGVHGANRLASNSLLEGLVFGARVASSAARHSQVVGEPSAEASRTTWELIPGAAVPKGPIAQSARSSRPLPARDDVRDLAWAHLGLIRTAEGLETALATLAEWGEGPLSALAVNSVEEGEVRNLVFLARLVGLAALRRQESRGSHYRTDFPETRSSYRRSLPFRLENGKIRVEGPLGASAAVASEAVAKSA